MMHKADIPSLLVTLLVMLFILPAHGLDAQDAQDWQEDIEFYQQQLTELHIDAFHSLSKSKFDGEISRIVASLPIISRNELLVELMRLTHRIGDGHTSFPLWSQPSGELPVALKLFADSVYVIATSDDYSDLLGARLVSINGVSTASLVEQFSTLTPFSENEYSTAVRVAEYLVRADLLNGLQIINGMDPVSAAFEIDGQIQTRQLRPEVSPDLSQQLSYLEPTLFPRMHAINDDLWYGASPDNKTVYIRFHRYPSHEDMEAFAINLLEFVNQHGSENLIIDLRDNYGGDFFVGLKLAQALVLADSINWLSGVYTLIDNVTFSAAMSNATQYVRILNARLIGQPTGGRPTGYQDMGQFTLPNSGLEVTYSKRLYRFGDDQSDAVYPNIPIDNGIEDYRNGRDSQLRRVVELLNTSRQ